MPRHIFFDLDNTLMMSRTLMASEHQPIFKELCAAKDVIVVSGARESQIRNQIPDAIGAEYFVLAQMGNHSLDKNGALLWRETFSDEQTTATHALIQKIHDELTLPVSNENDLIEDRGSQISYSLIGHHESLEKKYTFDPGNAKRLKILEAHKADVAALQGKGVDVVAGGTTCLDFFLAGKTKGFNIERLVAHENWKKDDCVYIGDALFPGGNDETVIGVIPTHPVKGPEETFRYIQDNLLS